MYDFQYLMLITSTILEGNYYGRNTKVDEYLENFNHSFPDHEVVSSAILEAVKLIEKLKFSEKSYWYNKANIFTLIIELAKSKFDDLNINKLELELLKLEDKVDLYFSAEEEDTIEDISEDERKYFEFARHSSHEKAAREHRGKVIKNILDSCLVVDDSTSESIESNNIEYFNSKGISFTTISPTQTGLNKGQMDAVSAVREFLKAYKIHNYDEQGFGPYFKTKLTGKFNESGTFKDTEVSLYRSNGRGDYRIWFSDLKSFAKANDNLALLARGETLFILNISKYDYKDVI